MKKRKTTDDDSSDPQEPQEDLEAHVGMCQSQGRLYIAVAFARDHPLNVCLVFPGTDNLICAQFKGILTAIELGARRGTPLRIIGDGRFTAMEVLLMPGQAYRDWNFVRDPDVPLVAKKIASAILAMVAAHGRITLAPTQDVGWRFGSELAQRHRATHAFDETLLTRALGIVDGKSKADGQTFVYAEGRWSLDTTRSSSTESVAVYLHTSGGYCNENPGVGMHWPRHPKLDAAVSALYWNIPDAVPLCAIYAALMMANVHFKDRALHIRSTSSEDVRLLVHGESFTDNRCLQALIKDITAQASLYPGREIRLSAARLEHDNVPVQTAVLLAQDYSRCCEKLYPEGFPWSEAQVGIPRKVYTAVTMDSAMNLTSIGLWFGDYDPYNTGCFAPRGANQLCAQLYAILAAIEVGCQRYPDENLLVLTADRSGLGADITTLQVEDKFDWKRRGGEWETGAAVMQLIKQVLSAHKGLRVGLGWRHHKTVEMENAQARRDKTSVTRKPSGKVQPTWGEQQ